MTILELKAIMNGELKGLLWLIVIFIFAIIGILVVMGLEIEQISRQVEAILEGISK